MLGGGGPQLSQTQSRVNYKGKSRPQKKPQKGDSTTAVQAGKQMKNEKVSTEKKGLEGLHLI